MKTITLEQLLEAGCHFGHQVTRQNPKARDYVFEVRDNIHIIDLAKTKEGLDAAAVFIREIAKKDGTMVIVGTKRQAVSIIQEETARVKEALPVNPGIYFITKRWIGGLLTNFHELEKNFKRLKEYTKLLASSEQKSRYTKKELGLFDKERVKLESFYSGIKDIKKIPDVLLVIDSHLEYISVREALEMHIPTVAIVDTNADPTIIDYPIPANDDADGSIRIILGHLLDAWIEGKKQAQAPKEEQETKEKEVVSSEKAKKDKETAEVPVKDKKVKS